MTKTKGATRQRKATKLTKQNPPQEQPGGQPNRQAGLPGTGFLMFEKHLTDGQQAWSGPFTSVEGVHHVMNALAAPGKGYDVTIWKPSPIKSGEPWQKVDEFVVPPFNGSALGKDVESKAFGKMKASPWKTRTSGLNAVRFQILNAAGRPDVPLI